MKVGLDLMRTRVSFRDRSVADVLDLALRFLVVHGRTYAKVAGASIVPAAMIALLAGWWLGWAAAWAVALPLAAIVEIPFTVLASRLVFQDEVQAREVLRSALRDGARVVLARAIVAVIVVVGLSFIVIPGIWLATIFWFLGEAILLERGSIGQAFVRSQRLAASAPADALLGFCVLVLLAIGSVFLADIAGRAVIEELFQFRPPGPLWNEGGSALATIGLFAQVPYLATARFFLYLNVRTRTEGWDIQTRFAAIAARLRQETEEAT